MSPLRQRTIVLLFLVLVVGTLGALFLPEDAVHSWSLLSYVFVGLALILRCREERLRLVGLWGLVLATILCALVLDICRALLALESAGSVEVYGRTVLSVLALVLGSITAVVALGPAARHAAADRWGNAANLFIFSLGLDVWRTLLQHDQRWEAGGSVIIGLRVVSILAIVVALRKTTKGDAISEDLAAISWLGLYFLLSFCAMFAMDLGVSVRMHSMIRIVAGGVGVFAMAHRHFPLVGRLFVLDRGRVPLSDWRRVASAAVILNPLVAWLVLYGYTSRLAVSIGVVGLTALWLAAIAATSLTKRARLPRSAGGRRARSRSDVESKAGLGESKGATAPANVLIEKLAGALIDDELELHYQPVVDVHSTKIVGAEALLRWRQPDRSSAAPAHVLHLARVGGISRQLEAWILQRAFRDAAALASQLTRPNYLGVNITAAQLERPTFGQEVLSLRADIDLPKGFLVLELTEYEALEDWDAARRTMEELQAHGIHFALDDYGAGVANLQTLTELSFDVVKLDRTFIIGSKLPAKSKMLDESLRAVQTLGVTVVLEGVEDPTASEVIDLVSQVDLAQGYGYGHPMPLASLEELIATNRD